MTIDETPPHMFGVYDLVRKFLGDYSLTGSGVFISVQNPFDAGCYDYDDSHLPYWRKQPGYYSSEQSPYTYVRNINYPIQASDDMHASGEVHVYKSSVQWWIEFGMYGPFFKSYLANDESDDLWVFADAVARHVHEISNIHLSLPYLLPGSSVKFVTIDDHMAVIDDEPPTIRFWELCREAHNGD